jgi:hypothetical protein
MSCKPTYKGVRYNSLEELYKANGVNPQQKQQAQQLYSQYLEQNPNGTVEQFKSWVDNNQSNVQYQLPQDREQEEFVASEKTIRDLEENIDMNYKTPTIGERALISIGNSKFIGLIIGNEFVTNKFLYIYKDDKGYKLGVTSQYNIVGTEIPRNTNQNIINNDDLINISYYINNILKNNKSVQSILEKDYDRLNNLTFNVSDLNNYSTILSDDILYNPETKLLYKVIDSGYNLINGIKHFYIKTVVKMSDNTFRYFNIDRNSLHNYILFTKRLNESFANLSIQKSRIEVFREPQVQSKSYVEVKVYKNPNNFIFILPANVNPIESNIAEKGYKDITQEYKKLMQDRYK